MRKFSFLLLVMMLTVAFSSLAVADDEAKWSPRYGENGELLNPETSVNFYRTYTSGGNNDYPVIATDVLTEDFESAWTSASPPAGWTIIDNGTEGSQAWYEDDWYKYNYSTWSSNTARIYYLYSIENNYDEWLISPSVVLPGGATACSLSFKNYYNDDTPGSKDTAYVKISTDGGFNWTNLVVWDEDHYSSPYMQQIDITAYAGQTVQVAFNLVCNTGAYGDIYDWKLDDIAIWADDTQLMLEDFETWGPYGDNPPSGWTILDNGTPMAAEGPWNDNDWYKYDLSTGWTSSTARVFYESSYDEWQDDWIISPTFALSSGALCSLKVVEYYYHYSSSYVNDHGYILLSTDGGTTWPDTLAHHTNATVGNSTTKVTFAYDLGDYSGESNLKVAFQFTNTPYGNSYWRIDDFLIEEFVMAADDVAKSAINAPTMAIEGYSWDIQTTVTNLGTNSATFDDSTYIERIVKTQYFFEDFNYDWGPYADNPPTGWTILDYGDEAVPAWNLNDWNRYSYWSGYVARASYNSSYLENQNEWLITPGVNLTGVMANIYMTFHSYFNADSDPDSVYILGSTDDGTTWPDTLAFWNTPHTNENPVFDITSWAANQSNVKIAFIYQAYQGGVFYVDDVEIYSLAYPAAEYVDGENVIGLASLDDTLITYTAQWTPSGPDDYVITSFTSMAADADNSNDTLVAQITCYPHFGSGGPDAAYYSWEDNITGSGNAFNWYDISASGTPVTWDLGGTGDDRYTSSIAMGLDFLFYGNTYNSIFLSENGFASFDSLTSGYASNASTMPYSNSPQNVLALLWDDLKASTGTAYYLTVDYDADSDNEFIVQYDGWEYYSTSLTSTIQMQMIFDPTDNSIIFQYNQHGPDFGTYTVGIEDGAGEIGLLYYNYYTSTTNTNHPGNSALPGLAITYTYDPPQVDGTVASIDIPAPGSEYLVGETFTPTVTISALGNDALTAQVTLKIYDESATEVYNQTETSAEVPGLSSIQHAFATDYTIGSEGVFDVVAFVVVPLDANTANDTLTSDFEAFTHYSEGGPDEFGYRYIDNIDPGAGLDLPPAPTFNWIDISASGDTIGSGSGYTGYSNPVALGFDFSFYGTTYSSLYVLGYGYITFGNYFNSYGSNYCMPYSSTSYDDPTIAMFWDSGYPNSTYDGYVFAQTFGDAPNRYTVVQYQNFRRSSYYENVNFEVILYENGDILIQYLNVDETDQYGQGQSATVGIQSENSFVPARVGLNYECNDDPHGNLLVDSLAVLFYYYQPAIDPIMVSLDAPVGGEVGTETFPAVTVENNGTSATTMDVTVEILDDELTTVYNVTETTASIDPGVTAQHVFTTGWTPSAAGAYTADASVYVAGDEFDENNYASGSLTIYDSYLDFEADNGGLLATNDWQWGTPSGESPAAHSGNSCWGTILDGGNLTPSTISDLDFKVQLTGVSPSLTFYQWYEGSTSSYYFRIFVDEVLVHQWQGNNTSWNPYVLDLSTYSGVVDVRLQMEIGTFVTYEGWYVDDFGFIDCDIFFPADEVEVVSIDSPVGLLSGGDTYDIVATIKNNGSNTVTFDVDAFDNYTYTQTQTVTDLAQFETTQVTFTGWTVMACSSYTVTVVTDLLNDEITENDTLAADYLALPSYNTAVQYDDDILVNATRFVEVENVIANEFYVPYQGTELSAIGYVFAQDGENDTVNVHIFLDSDDDGVPDTIPAYSDQIVTAGYGETIWLIGCEVTPVIVGCESFWAGWSLVDTVAAGNEAWMGIDNTNDHGMGWGMWRDETSGQFTWNPWNSVNDGDNMIRAYYDIDETTAPIASVDPSAVSGAADQAGSDVSTSTLFNTVVVGCDLDYTVSVQQFAFNTAAADQSMSEPIDWVPAHDKTADMEIIQGQTENLIPVYPPVTLGFGGPDAYGYSWIDSDEDGGPFYDWVDISSIGTEINWPTATDSLDDQIVTVPMGMTFNFYGVDYSDLTISTNGWASFLSQTSSYLSDAAIPTAANPNALLAVHWDDLEGQYPAGVYGSAYYYYDATANQFIVSWTNWHHYANAENLNFQVILDADNGLIKYQYSSVHPSYTDYTVGIENADGTVGLQVARLQSYLKANLAIAFYVVPPTWLSTNLVSGSVAAGGSVPFDIYMDATELDCGVYNGAIVITTNDPLNPMSQVSVQFTVGSDINGTVTDAGDAALEGVAVDLLESDVVIASTTTNASGYYEFTCQTAGTYDVSFSLEGYYDAETEVIVGAGSSTTVDMTLDAPGHYGGIVTDGDTNPLEGVHVWAEVSTIVAVAELPRLIEKAESEGSILKVHEQDQTRPLSLTELPESDLPVLLDVTLITDTYTDATGAYALVLEAGSYTVDFSKTGYYDAQVAFDIALNETITQDMVMNVASSYSGTVTDEEDAPLEGVHVWAEIPVVVASIRGESENASDMPELTKVYGNIKKDYSNIGDPVRVDNVDNIQAPGYEPPMVDAEYCDIVLGGAYVGAYTGQVWGLESWAVFQDPATCALTETYPYQVFAMMFSLQNTTGSAQQVDFTLSVHEADMTTPSCPLVGDAVYTSGSYSVVLQSGFVYTIGDYPVNAIVNGPYFMVLNITSDHSTAQLDWPVGANTATPCVAYNDYGSGWVDLSGFFAYDPVEWWHSQGFSTTVDNIVTETWTDVNGDYTLALNPGDYNIHYELTGYHPEEVGPVTLGLNENSTGNDVVMNINFHGPVTIHDIQYSTDLGTSYNGCYDSPYYGDGVITTGTVTGMYQGAEYRYFIQDCTDTDWNGVYIYGDAVEGMAIGDNVTFTADVTEYNGVTELQNITDFTTNSTGNAICTTTVTSDEIGIFCDEATAVGEAHEGMLVRLENVTIITDTLYGMHYVITEGATNPCLLDDDLYYNGTDQPEPLEVGETYEYIIGIVHYAYSQYKVNPRFASDVADLDYAYLVGDANMRVETVPKLLGSDVTYLVNFFIITSGTPGCKIAYTGGEFYMSADVNGSCTILGSDVTRLVSVLSGAEGAVLEHCADYTPKWLNNLEAPTDPGDLPAGWPPCVPLPPVTSTKIPSVSE